MTNKSFQKDSQEIEHNKKSTLKGGKFCIVEYIVNKEFKHIPLPREELISAGHLGYYKAKKNFDDKHKAHLNTYASHYVRGEIKELIRLEIRNSDTHKYTEDDYFLEISLADPDDLEKTVLNEELLELFHVLNEKERLVIECYFFKGMSLKEISESLKVSSQYIGQLKDQGLNKLKNAIDRGIDS